MNEIKTNAHTHTRISKVKVPSFIPFRDYCFSYSAALKILHRFLFVFCFHSISFCLLFTVSIFLSVSLFHCLVPPFVLVIHTKFNYQPSQSQLQKHWKNICTSILWAKRKTHPMFYLNSMFETFFYLRFVCVLLFQRGFCSRFYWNV